MYVYVRMHRHIRSYIYNTGICMFVYTYVDMYVHDNCVDMCILCI